jgi:hypothetical protein
MTDWKLPWTAGCRCDRVRMRITAPPLLTRACHCTGCQRMSASAFSLTVTVPAKAFEVTAGEPVIGGLHGPNKHHFCSFCKSWLFTIPEGPLAQMFTNVRATMLDERRWFAPFVEVSRAEGLPWAHTGAVHSFPDIPPMEAYTALVAEFAEKGPRP